MNGQYSSYERIFRLCAPALALGAALGCGGPASVQPDDSLARSVSALMVGNTNVSDGLAGLHGNSDAESQTVAVSMGGAIAVAYNSFFVPTPDTRCPGLSQIAMSYLTGPSWQAIHIPVSAPGIAALRFTPSIAYRDNGSSYRVYVSNVAYSTAEWPNYNGNHDPNSPGNDCIPYNHKNNLVGYTELNGDRLCVSEVDVPKNGAVASVISQSCFGEPSANYYDTALTMVANQPYVVSWNRATASASFLTTTGIKLATPYPGQVMIGAPIFAKQSQIDLVAPDSRGAFWWTTLNASGADPTQWTWSAPLSLNDVGVPYHWGDTSLPDGIATNNQYTALVVNGFMGPGSIYLFYRSGTSVVGFARGQGSGVAPFQVFTSRSGFNAFTPAAEDAIIPNEFGIAPGHHPMLTYWDDSGFQGHLVLNYTWANQPAFPGPGNQVPCPVVGSGYWGYRDDMVVQNNNTTAPKLWRFFTDSTPSADSGACDLTADEADHITYDASGAVTHQSTTPQHVSGFSVVPGNIDAGLIVGPLDWNTNSDWDNGYFKGSCSVGWGQFGLSVDTAANGHAHAIMCRKIDPTIFTGAYVGRVLAVPGDQRLMSRTVNGNSDWDPQFWKLECGNNQFVAGSSERIDNLFHGIHCGLAGGSGLHNTGCNVRVFANGDNMGATDHPDWDDQHFKGECAATDYLAGVSVDTGTYRPHALLCCPR
jgi:hypothetical protein